MPIRLKSEAGTAYGLWDSEIKALQYFLKKKTVRQCQWEGEAQDLGIQQVDKGEFATMKRLQSSQFEG